MIVTIVHAWVKPAFAEAFIEATLLNHRGTIKEPGNVRFDFLRDASDRNKFTIYEVFEDEEAVQAHKETAHYLTWRDTVSDWMAQPRLGVRHELIAPTSLALW